MLSIVLVNGREAGGIVSQFCLLPSPSLQIIVPFYRSLSLSSFSPLLSMLMCYIFKIFLSFALPTSTSIFFSVSSITLLILQILSFLFSLLSSIHIFEIIYSQLSPSSFISSPLYFYHMMSFFLSMSPPASINSLFVNPFPLILWAPPLPLFSLFFYPHEQPKECLSVHR